jgi:hypothetical protein
MADKEKRSYYLPKKLIAELEKECQRSGFVRERVVAAAVHSFLQASAQQRQQMFDTLHGFLGRGKHA